MTKRWTPTFPFRLRTACCARAQSGDGPAAEGNATGMMTAPAVPRTERGGSVSPFSAPVEILSSTGRPSVGHVRCEQRWHTTATLI